MRGLSAFVAGMLLAAPAMAQSVSMGGTTQPGDLPKIQSNRQLESAGDVNGDKNGKGVNPFSIYDRGDAGLCIRTGAVGSAHNAFCFGHDAHGNPLITVDSYGGMAAKTLKCRVNGVTSDCALSGGSGGGTALMVDAGGNLLIDSGGNLITP